MEESKLVWNQEFLTLLSTRITNEVEDNKINRAVYVLVFK